MPVEFRREVMRHDPDLTGTPYIESTPGAAYAVFVCDGCGLRWEVLYELLGREVSPERDGWRIYQRNRVACPHCAG